MNRLEQFARLLWSRGQTYVSLLRDVICLLRSPRDGSLGELAALVVVSGLCPVALVFVTRGLIDRLVAAIRTGGEWTSITSLSFWAAYGGALLLLSHVLSAAVEWKRTLHVERLKDHITESIHAQSVRLDLSFYESPEFFDRLHRAREEATYRPAELCNAFIDVLEGFVVLIGLGTVLLAFGLWLPVVFLLAALPVLYVVTTHALAYQRWRSSTTQDERRSWYYDDVLTSAHYAAELRLFETSRLFRRRHRAIRAKLRDGHLDLLWRRRMAEAGGAALGMLVMGSTTMWMVWRAVMGLVTLGQLAAFYHAFASGLSTARSLLSSLASMHTSALFIKSLFEFLALEPEIVSPKEPAAAPVRLRQGIRFQNVTFSYPGADRPALEAFNLHVSAGKTTAIVGANGAGKSTLIKLLCRLYDPHEGAIEIDEVDIRRLKLGELRGLISALFQPSVQYADTIERNIRLGTSSTILDEYDVRRAGALSGASEFIDRLPQGYNAKVGKLFDGGADLSAGEWQRLALSRAFARPSAILLLDEPTSSLDPWAEGDWHSRLRVAAGDRTVLIITHRLATARYADQIHVMEHGRIVESGTHDALVAKGGRYAACALGEFAVAQGFSPVQPVEVAQGFPAFASATAGHGQTRKLPASGGGSNALTV